MREFIINFLAVFGAVSITFIVYTVIDAALDDFEEERKRKCPYCGTPYRFHDNYCRKCGKSLWVKTGGERNE